jgi:hypothetical protein
MALSPNGTLYVAGSFTQDNNPPSGGGTLLRIGKLSAGRLVPVGSGFASSTVTSMAFDTAGNLYVAIQIGSSASNSGYQVFDGNKWMPMEVTPSGITSLGQVFITSDNRQIVTYDTNLAASTGFAGVTSIVNKGSAPAWPKIKIYGPNLANNGTTTVHKVANYTTGAVINLEYPMRFGEILTLDFSPRNIQITSNLFGSVKAKMVSNSQWANFFLASGRNASIPNRIVVHADISLTSYVLPAEIYWHNTYYGIAGSVK